MTATESLDPPIVATYAAGLRTGIQRLIDDRDCDIRAVLDLLGSGQLCGLITETRDQASRAWCSSVVVRLAGAAKHDRAFARRSDLGTALHFAKMLCERPDLVRVKHSEIEIYEAQNREDARACAENREPRLIKTMADITDKA